MNKTSVFISHIQEESSMAAILGESLSDAFLGAVEVFASSNVASIAAGDDWLNGIKNALRTADIEIVLLSPLSIKRPWVNFEAGAAWIRGITILPVCHSGLRPSDLAMPLCLIQAVEASQEAKLDQLFARVASHLKINKPKVALSRLVRRVKALEQDYGPRPVPPTWTVRSPDVSQEGRLIGSWEGEACDIQVPGFMPLDLKCSYKLRLELRQEGQKVCGELSVHVNERDHTANIRMELINVAGDNFTFTYRILQANATQFGIMMFQLLPLGDTMNGYFLTNKAFEPKLAAGTVQMKRV